MSQQKFITEQVPSNNSGYFLQEWVKGSILDASLAYNPSNSLIINVALNKSVPVSGQILEIGKAVTLQPADTNSSIIASAEVDASPNFVRGNTTLETDLSATISSKIDNDNGKVTLNGIASIDEYNALIRSIQVRFANYAPLPDFKFIIKLKDINGNISTRSITIRSGKVVASIKNVMNDSIINSAQEEIASIVFSNDVTYIKKAMPQALLRETSFGIAPLQDHFVQINSIN
jgi:hypothetical protein